MRRYRLSEYVRSFSLDEASLLVAHPFFLQYSVLEDDAIAVYHVLQDGAQTAAGISSRLSLPAERVQRILDFFQTRHFVFVNDQDEDRTIAAYVREIRDASLGIAGHQGHGRLFADYPSFDNAALEVRVPVEAPQEVRFLLLGSCLTHYSASALEHLGPSCGLNVRVETSWPDRLESLRLEGFDVVVFNPFSTWLLAPLWDALPFIDDAERKVRLESIKTYLRTSLTTLLSGLEGALLLVQGIAGPIHSPLGRSDFRSEYGLRRITYELNATLVEAIRGNPDATFIDEEQLVSRTGKWRLLDDSLVPTSHHGAVHMPVGRFTDGPTKHATFGLDQTPSLPRHLARAYLDAFIAWRGIGRVRCIIVDLDHTLWPGSAGDADFDLEQPDAAGQLLHGVFGGIHQALKIMRHRGVLLAVCSRNEASDVERAWDQVERLAQADGQSHMLCRNDFVLARIGWEPKSQGVAEILSRLAIPPSAALYIDDSAAERAEVAASFPTLRQLGENMYLVRASLLDDASLENDSPTQESQLRTELVRAQLTRDAVHANAPNDTTFLRELGIRLRVARAAGERHVPRMLELLHRTNQFNTTLLRMNRRELLNLIAHPDGAVFLLEVSDRFASYGVVGICVLWKDEVRVFAMSCRVIPLRAAVPFLVIAPQEYGRWPIHAEVVMGPRNQPCRQLFSDAGFEQVSPGHFVLRDPGQLVPVDTDIYAVEGASVSSLDATVALDTEAP